MKIHPQILLQSHHTSKRDFFAFDFDQNRATQYTVFLRIVSSLE